MKKTLFLLVALLMGLSAQAAFTPEAGAYYALKHVQTGKYLQFNTSYTETNAVNATTLSNEAVSTFVVDNYSNGFSFYNVQTEEYMTLGTIGAGTGQEWNAGHSTTAYAWLIEDAGNEQYYICKNTASSKRYLGDQGKSYLYIDNTRSSACLWEFVKVGAAEAQTYAVVIEGADVQITYDGQQYGNGDTFQATGVSASQIEAPNVEETEVSVRVEGTTVYVTYTAWPTWTVSITGAEGSIEFGGQTYTDGQSFKAAAVSTTDITVQAIAGYKYRISLNGNTILVEYREGTTTFLSGVTYTIEALGERGYTNQRGNSRGYLAYSPDKSETYLSAVDVTYGYSRNSEYAGSYVTSSNPNANIYWNVIETSGMIKLQNQGNKKYLCVQGNEIDFTENEAEASVFEYSENEQAERGYTLTEVASGKYIGFWSGWGNAHIQDEEADFVFTEVETVEIEIGTEGVSTFYNNVPTRVPAGLTAYIATRNNNYLTMTALTSNIIPANTGVVLTGEAGTYAMNAYINAGSGMSALTGSVEATATPEGCCTLNIVDGVLGFYTYAGATVAAHKAYYIAPAGVSGLAIQFGTEGISTIATNQSTKAFDLQGRRIQNTVKGIMILGGKKVIK